MGRGQARSKHHNKVCIIAKVKNPSTAGMAGGCVLLLGDRLVGMAYAQNRWSLLLSARVVLLNDNLCLVVALAQSCQHSTHLTQLLPGHSICRQVAQWLASHLAPRGHGCGGRIQPALSHSSV